MEQRTDLLIAFEISVLTSSYPLPDRRAETPALAVEKVLLRAKAHTPATKEVLLRAKESDVTKAKAGCLKNRFLFPEEEARLALVSA